jgi:hypothetical protein
VVAWRGVTATDPGTCLNVKLQKTNCNDQSNSKRQTANRTPRVGAITVSLFRRLISHCRLLFAFSMFARRGMF